MYEFNRKEYEERMKWYKEARFGMFIHWGIYAIPARGEWVRSPEEMPEEEYMKYFEEFDPVDYDPKKWAKAAKEAGMKYAVLTAKHHDGFCLFDSALTDFKSTNTKCGRDLVREYLDAFRAEGLKVGLYYSLLDWHHPDYPHYGDQHHPMRNNPAESNEGRDFNKYLEYMHGQVRELCTNYGRLDLLYTDLRATADLSLGANRRQVMLSNLVFLGVNTQRLGLPDGLRNVLSGLLDRSAIARRAYRGFAAAADSPIKQSYSSTPGGEEAPPQDALEAQLAALGYGERDAGGWRTYRNRPFSLRLLVNAGNPDREAAAAIVQDAFQGAGFRVTLEAVPFEEYTLRIAEGNYDLYLGELRITNNLDLASLIGPDPAVGPGCVRDEELLEIYRRAKAGEAELSALDSALRRVVPVIPLVYRRGIVAISPDFSANIVATEQDIFYNIGEW